MGGKGGIVALGGILSNVPAIERKQGLDAALAANPDVKLLDFQVANWIGHRGARDDQCLADPVRRRDRRHLGGQRRHGRSARSKRCAPTAAPARCRSPASTASSSRSRRSSSGEMAGTVAWDPYWQGGMGLSIGYHAKTGKFDPDQGAEGSPRVLRHRRASITKRQRQGVLRHQHQGRAEARLERHLGPRHRPDPVRLSSSCGRRRGAAPPDAIATAGGAPASPPSPVDAPKPCVETGHVMTRHAADAATPAAGRRGSMRRRWRLASWAPVLVLILLCAVISAINPNFLDLRQLRPHRPGGDDPAGARPRRDLRHPDGLDRPVGRGRADAVAR